MHWAAIFTSIGEMLGGRAIILALLQLGGLRRDRLRAQVSKIGAWAGSPEPTPSQLDVTEWAIPAHIRNSSELPAEIDSAELSIHP